MTSGLQEDHVSMGESAALKLAESLDNALLVLAIEYVLAAQALEFVEARPLGRGTGRAVALLREDVAAYDDGHPLFLDFKSAAALMRQTDATALARGT